MKSERVRVGEHLLNVRIWKRSPEAPVVVLVHGLIVSSRYMVPLASILARDFTVYVPELPGSGASSKPRRVLRVGELGAVLTQWMSVNEITDATVVANSYGCQVAIEAAVLDSQRISSMVLIGPTVDPRARNPYRQMARMARCLPHEPWWFIPVALRDTFDCGLRAALSWTWDMTRHDTAARARLVEAPVTVLRGEHDFVATQPWVEELAAATGGPMPRPLHGGGHIIHGRRPQLISDLVRSMTSVRS